MCIFADALWYKQNPKKGKDYGATFLWNRLSIYNLKRFQLQSPGKTLIERASEEVGTPP